MINKEVFWKADVFNRALGKKQTFILGPSQYSKERILEILYEIHPEYENIVINPTKKPKNLK